MKEPQNQMSIGNLPFDALDSRWDQIARHAHEIADEVDIKSEGASGSFRLQTLAISHFFRSSCDYQKALNQPYVLAVANPLAALAANGPLNRGAIATAIHAGLCAISRHGSTHRSLWRVFLYPIFLTYFAAIGSILAAHFIVPPFEQLYTEFGIALPLVTRGFFSLGYFIRVYTFTILMVLLGLPPLFWLLNWIGHETREPGMSRLDLWFSGKRMTAARFLFHVSLLLEAGLTKNDAISKATTLSGKQWLKRRLAIRESKLKNQINESKVRFFDRVHFRTGDTALAAPRSPGQVILLQQVATWYRESSSNIIEWIVQLMIPLYVFAILFTFFIFIMCLLTPMIAVITGLTGGGPGGFM